MPILYVFKNEKLLKSVQINGYEENYIYQDSKKKTRTLPVHIVFISYPGAVVRAVLVASYEVPDSSLIKDAIHHRCRKVN